MTDVQVTEADRKAAEAYENLDFSDTEHLANMFAAHAARAVQAERKRVIRIIQAKQKQYAESAERSGFPTWRAAADVMLQFENELADQLEKGVG